MTLQDVVIVSLSVYARCVKEVKYVSFHANVKSKISLLLLFPPLSLLCLFVFISSHPEERHSTKTK